LEETLSISAVDTDSTPRDPAPSLADDRVGEAQDPTARTPAASATRTPAQILREWRAAERELADNPADGRLIAAVRALRDEFERATESRR
jgi:hypothetical protein